MSSTPGRAGTALPPAAGLTLTILLLGACASVPTQSASMQTAPELAASATQLQLRSFEMGRALSTLIEQAADSIQTTSPDPVTRRTALLWKVSGIPLVQEAALRLDPLVAAVDLAAFTIQQLDYFTTGSGRDAFGPQQSIAVAAARESERIVLASAGRNLKSGRLSPQFAISVRQWAAEHPMHGPTLTRATILDSDWDALGLSAQSLQATIGNVDRTITNITYRLSFLNETLAKQARWNAELAMAEAMDSPRVDSIYGIGTATLGSVGTFLDSTPALLDRQREALMRDVDRQRVLAFQDIAAQVRVLEVTLAQERAALMAQVGQEREATLLAADSVVSRSLIQSEVALDRLLRKVLVGALLVVLALLGSGMLLIQRWKAVTT
jgi:hypothetical protein